MKLRNRMYMTQVLKNNKDMFMQIISNLAYSGA